MARRRASPWPRLVLAALLVVGAVTRLAQHRWGWSALLAALAVAALADAWDRHQESRADA